MSLIKAANKQQGFSLVEVLIAMIIMSVGMLGIAGLYVQSLQAGRTSMYRHHAVHLAGDVADRIRANPTGGISYMDPGSNNNCVDANYDCDITEMARNDIWLWEQQAIATLPNGTVTVTFDNTVAPPNYTVVVAWDEPGETPSYTVTFPANPF